MLNIICFALVQMTHAEEISEALKDSLSILKENKNAKEFRQLMHLDPNESEGKEEIEKVNSAMSQVGLTLLFLMWKNHASGL